MLDRSERARPLGFAAGTVIYLDLWAASQGIDLAQAICDEFNRKSEEIGYAGRLGNHVPCDDCSSFDFSCTGKCKER